MTGRSCRRSGLGSPQAAYVLNYGLPHFGVRVSRGPGVCRVPGIRGVHPGRQHRPS